MSGKTWLGTKRIPDGKLEPSTMGTEQFQATPRDPRNISTNPVVTNLKECRDRPGHMTVTRCASRSLLAPPARP